MHFHQVIITALNEEDTQAYLKSLIKILLSDRETRQAAIGLLHYIFGEAEVKQLMAEFFRQVLQSQMVVDQATQLGRRGCVRITWLWLGIVYESLVVGCSHFPLTRALLPAVAM